MVECLKNISDIERILGRLSLGSGNARDLVALKLSFLKIPEIKKLLKEDIDELTELAALIEKAILDEPPLTLREGGIIKENFNSELDKLRNISRKGKNFIKELQIKESKRTGRQSSQKYPGIHRQSLHRIGRKNCSQAVRS